MNEILAVIVICLFSEFLQPQESDQKAHDDSKFGKDSEKKEKDEEEDDHEFDEAH
jgi:hypothetical protein